MAFTHAQATATANVSGVATSLNVVLTNNPANTDCVCFGGQWFNASGSPATFTVADANSNSYTKSTNSPSSTNASTSGAAFGFHLDNASGASKTITATFTSPGSSGSVEIFADDFTVSGGTASFDKDAVGSGNASTINTPTVTRTGSNELLWCFAAVEQSISGVGGTWTQGAIGGHGNATEYILSSSVDVAANFSQGVSGHWDSVGMSFSISAGGAKLRRNANLEGLSSSGPFFANPLESRSIVPVYS